MDILKSESAIVIRIPPNDRPMVAETGAIVQIKRIRPCLNLNLQP